MKKTVAVDVSPLYSQDRFRGVGSYTRNLQQALKTIQKKLDFDIKFIKNSQDLLEKKFDLIHFPYFSPFFLTLSKKIPSPFVVTVHDLIPIKHPNHFPAGIRGGLKWLIQKNRLKKASSIITDSLFWRKEIARLINFDEEKIYSIMLAAGDEFKVIKDKKQLKTVREKYHLPERFVLYVGDVNWNKNIPATVEACRLSNLPLVMVGKSIVSNSFNKNHPESKNLVWLQQQIKQFGAKDDGFRILPLGFVPGEDLVALYNLAYCFCFPSFDEGFGLPVLEAFGCGCPVITSSSGSLPEVAGKAAIIVDPEKPQQIAEALTGRLENKDQRSKLVNEGFKQVDRFSWAKTASQTAAVYKKLLEIND